MKKVFIILFESEGELLKGSEKITERFANADTSKIFCGSWGEI